MLQEVAGSMTSTMPMRDAVSEAEPPVPAAGAKRQEDAPEPSLYGADPPWI